MLPTLPAIDCNIHILHTEPATPQKKKNININGIKRIYRKKKKYTHSYHSSYSQVVLGC